MRHIISGSKQEVTFYSEPDNATVTVKNKKGAVVYSRTTPTTVSLKRSEGFFSPEKYTVSFSKTGYKTTTLTISSSINGWYFANILFGGFVGMLIVDPLTGGMYTLNPEDINATLAENKVKVDKNSLSLNILLKENVSSEIMSRAIALNK